MGRAPAMFALFPSALSARCESGVVSHRRFHHLISQEIALFVKLRGRFDTRCSGFHLLHRRRGELFLVDRLGVAGDLAQAGVPGDRPDLMFGAARLSKSARRSLAQPVRTAMLQSGAIALLAEPVAESCCREWLPELRREER